MDKSSLVCFLHM